MNCEKYLIKYLVMDVDGTMTDGKIYVSGNGELFKAFNVKDGYAITSMLGNIKPIIITGRQSEIVNKRAEDLGIVDVFQGIKDKLRCLNEFLAESNSDGVNELKSVAYIGDDLNDIPIINAVNDAGGVTGCPADAAAEVRKLVKYICDKKAGDGAVREFVEWIISM